MSANVLSIKVAWRNILRQRGYSLIHVLGLSVGICVCMVIFVIGRYELSFDRFHPDADRIYRIVGDVQDKDGNVIFLNSPFKEVAHVERLIAGVGPSAAFHIFGGRIFVPAPEGGGQVYDNKQAGGYALSTILTGPEFFALFPHRWIAGDSSVLSQPGRLVLTESVARRYFGKVPVGQMLDRKVIYDDSLIVRVAGIVRDWEQPSDLGYTSFISIGTAAVNGWLGRRIPTTDWSSLQPRRSQAFVRLPKGVRPDSVNAMLAGYLRGLPSEPLLFPGANHLRLYLESLRDMHYTPDFHPADTGDDFRKAYLPLLYGLMWVAIFVLGLAIINFINLSTAQSFQRMKEVGVRKVMGSSRGALIGQFLIETLLLTVCAVLFSLVLVWPAFLLFDGSIPAGVRFRVLDGGNWLFLGAITVGVTLVAGFYPARLMSSYLPVLSLKGSLDKQGTGGVGLRRALIVFQFSVSLLFIIGSLVIGRQVRLSRNGDKGFNSDGVVTVDYPSAARGQMLQYAAVAAGVPGVEQAIVEGNPPMGRVHPTAHFVYRWQEKKIMKEFTPEIEIGDNSFQPFYQLKLLAGGNMWDGENVVPVLINETFAHMMGFNDPAGALGKQLYYRETGNWYGVCGVVQDYHQVSFHETIRPVIIVSRVSEGKSVAVRLRVRGDSVRIAMAGLERQWNTLFPGVPFTGKLLSDTIGELYLEENRSAMLMQTATVIMVLISCMGLFGLALFSAGRRAKEIGIRKVLGATVASVSLLLSREFLLLVAMAIVITSPVAWWLCHVWLQGFGYRAAIDGWVLAEAGVAALVLAAITVGFQAYRVARVNPVEVLRDV